MGGKEGIQGYIYQTIISVVQFLNNDEWEFVTIEPNNESEKVDIVWESETSLKTCQQVKSSINNFQKSDIIKWLEELLKHRDKFNSIELILIGNTSQDTTTFIKKINDSGVVSESQLINDNIAKIRIKIYPFRQDSLENDIVLGILKFLEQSGINVKPSAGQLMLGGLVYQFLQFSIIGEKASRTTVHQFFENWIKINYSNQIIKTNSSAFSLFFYEDATKKFETTLNGKKVNIREPAFLKNQVTAIYNAYKAAKQIELPERDKKPELPENSFGLSRFVSSLTEDSEADIDEETKTTISDYLKKRLNISLTNSFFNVGNLMRSPFTAMSFLMPGRDYKGTSEELEKHEKIFDLYREIKAMNELLNAINFFNSLYGIAMVIENTGERYDEEVNVDLKFPKDIRFVNPDDFYIPDNYKALSVLIESDFMEEQFASRANSLVKGFEGSYFPNYEAYRSLDTMYAIGGFTKRLENRKEHLLAQAQQVFDNEIFHDDDNFTLVRYHFKAINPGVKIFFPSLLLLDANKSFDIEYSVRSKHSGSLHEGLLSFKL